MSDHPEVSEDPGGFPRYAVALAVLAFVFMTLVPRSAATLVPLILVVIIVASARLPSVRGSAFVPAPLFVALATVLGWFILRGPAAGWGREAISSVSILAAYIVLLTWALYSSARMQPDHSQVERRWFAIGLLIASMLVFAHLATNQVDRVPAGGVAAPVMA